VPIRIEIDVMLARRKLRSKDVAREVGLNEVNFSLLKSGKVKGIKFETLARLCEVLRCQPADILTYAPESVDGTEAKTVSKRVDRL